MSDYQNPPIIPLPKGWKKPLSGHGQEFGLGDNLFFDMPPVEHAEHFMVQAMRQAGLHPAIIYAFEKTGRPSGGKPTPAIGEGSRSMGSGNPGV